MTQRKESLIQERANRLIETVRNSVVTALQLGEKIDHYQNIVQTSADNFQKSLNTNADDLVIKVKLNQNDEVTIPINNQIVPSVDTDLPYFKFDVDWM